MSTRVVPHPWNARSLEQDTHWQSNDGGYRRIENMTDEHVANLIAYIRREAAEFKRNEVGLLRSQAFTHPQGSALRYILLGRATEISEMGRRHYVESSPLMQALKSLKDRPFHGENDITISLTVPEAQVDVMELARRIEWENTSRRVTRPSDPLDKMVRLRDVLTWVQDWVPKPARPLWEKAFVDKFGGDHE